MRTMKKYWPFLISLALIYGCSSQKAISLDLLITDVNIVDVKSGQLIMNQQVGIRNDTIVWIDDMNSQRNVLTADSLDGENGYLIPALWDMHVHFRGGIDLIEENKNLLPLYTAYGISGVRDAGGDLTPSVMEWRKEIREGKLIGPDIFTSGPKLDGPRATWAGSIPVVTNEDIKSAIDSIESIGADYIKIYDSRISKEAYLGIIAEAKKRNITTSGHMPFTVMLEEAVTTGIGSIEHLYYILKGCSSREAEITQDVIDGKLGFWSSFEQLMDSYDENVAQTTFNRLKASGTFVVPTLHIGSILTLMKEQSHENDELLNYIGDGIISTYAGRVRGALRASDQVTARNKRLRTMFRELVPKLEASGVLLLAGSDGGASNSYVYPGFSLHKELEEMVNTGLSAAAALRTATINGAKFMKTDDFTGSIELGKKADLLLLYNNPLQEVRNTQDIHSMISNGRVLSKAYLNQLKESVRKQ